MEAPSLPEGGGTPGSQLIHTGSASGGAALEIRTLGDDRHVDNPALDSTC